MRNIVLALALLVIGCSKSAREERLRVLAGIERLEAVSSGDHKNRRAYANDLARVEVERPLPKAARDACSRAYLTGADRNEQLDVLEAETAASTQRDPQLRKDDFLKLLELDERAESEMKACQDAKQALAESGD